MKKLIFKLALLLIIPCALHAQDTTLVKKQANLMAQAMLKGDYATLVNNMYPKAVKMGGGKENMVKLVSKSMAQLKTQGVVFENATVQAPGKFYKAGTEIHCLVPETITMKVGTRHFAGHSNLLAISSNGGKSWSFLDLNNSSIAKIKQLLPNINPDMNIPRPTTEELP